MKKWIFTLSLILLAHASPNLSLITPMAQAEIYKWVDAQGNVQFGDTEPENAPSTEVKLKPNITGVQIGNPDLKFPEPATHAKSKKLIMYSTVWCGYCKKARVYFNKKGIAFDERDIEKSARAKAEHKKLGGGGIPLFSYGGKTYRGFSESGFKKFYQQ